MHVLPGGQPPDGLRHLQLAHAVNQKIRPGLLQNGRVDRVVPVIVVGEPPQRRLQPADHDGDVPVNLPDLSAVDRHRPIRTLSHDPAGGICVHRPVVFGDGVVSHHGIDIPGGDQKPVFRPAQLFKIPVALPIGLGKDAYREALILHYTGNDGDAEAGMIHIAVAGDTDVIQLFDAPGFHVCPADR